MSVIQFRSMLSQVRAARYSMRGEGSPGHLQRSPSPRRIVKYSLQGRFASHPTEYQGLDSHPVSRIPWTAPTSRFQASAVGLVTHKSSFSDCVCALETQIIIRQLDSRSSASKMESRWHGRPAKTVVEHVPQTPS